MLRALAIAAAMGLAALPAAAQNWQQSFGQSQPPDQWVMHCLYEGGRNCTVSAMIDGGPDNLTGTFVILSYSVAYRTLSVVTDGLGQSATLQVDWHPISQATNCIGAACMFDTGWSAELLNLMLQGQSITVAASLKDDSVAGPLQQSLAGFATQYRRAVAAQNAR